MLSSGVQLNGWQKAVVAGVGLFIVLVIIGGIIGGSG